MAVSLIEVPTASINEVSTYTGSHAGELGWYKTLFLFKV